MSRTVARRAGFTLIELLVAVAIFAVLTAFAYGALGGTLASAEFLTVRTDRLEAVQRTIRFLTRDFQQLAPRPVREQLGDVVSPALVTDFTSDFAVELTHGGWNNPAGLPRGTLQRVAWRLQDGELVRYHWTVLDRTLDNEPSARVLLDRVESVGFRFLQDNGEWTEEWPPADGAGGLGLSLRPRAVEIVLTTEDEGVITRLLEVAP
ncbi:MAG TPA: type II secretion system minor pseudopilin GspJ [Woeseiaceae bacterium]|nr:type II secretion system minor pseudopilin GspJ [Woeseiaceae bacterium]